MIVYDSISYPLTVSNPTLSLPETTPLKPLQVSLSGPETSDKTPTDPSLSERTGGGYVLSICNGATQSRTLQRVAVRLESVKPYTGQLNAWSSCSGPYTRSFSTGAGCG